MHSQQGSALVISIIVLAILGVLGVAALEVADINIFMAANDRDSKETFFHADSGVNLGHEFLEEAIYIENSTFYSDDAMVWKDLNNTNFSPINPEWADNASCTSEPTIQFYTNGTMATYVRAGFLSSSKARGSGLEILTGYDGAGLSAARGGIEENYLIRSRRYGQRNSFAEVDLGWKHSTAR